MIEMYENADDILKYIFTMLCSLVIASVYDYVKKKKQISWGIRWIAYVIISIPFAMMVGLRRYDVGADTKNYVRMFYEPQNINKNLEFVYKNIVYFCNNIGEGYNYSVLLLLFSFSTLFFILLAGEIMDEKTSSTLTLFLFFSFMGLNMTDQVRQMLTVSLFAVLVAFFKKKNYIYAGIIFFIAIGIHTSIIFALFLLGGIILLDLDSYVKIAVYDISMHLRVKLLLCIICLCLFIIVAFPAISSVLFTYMLPKYKFYFDTAIKIKNIGIGLLLDMAMPLLVVICIDKKKINKKEGVLYTYVFFTVIFRLLSYYSFFIGRMMFYTNIIGIILLTTKTTEYTKQRRKKMVVIMTIVGIFYFIFNIRNYLEFGHGAIPYYSVFDENFE